MQAKQRVIKPAGAFKPVKQDWVPYTVHGATGEGEPTEVKVQSGDHYASVDDVADGIVVFSVSAWPRLDREGRLYWDTSPVELVVPEQDAQATVYAGRTQAGITAPDRPIRVGDVFLVRGLPGKPASLSRASLRQASLVLDISAAARDAARAALYGAAASTLPIEDAEKMAVGQPYKEPEPAAGYFDIRQRKVKGPGGRGTAS